MHSFCMVRNTLVACLFTHLTAYPETSSKVTCEIHYSKCLETNPFFFFFPPKGQRRYFFLLDLPAEHNADLLGLQWL